MAGEGGLLVAAGRIPQPHGPVIARGGKPPPVRAERYPSHIGVVGEGGLRRPVPSRRNLLTQPPETPFVKLTVPSAGDVPVADSSVRPVGLVALSAAKLTESDPDGERVLEGWSLGPPDLVVRYTTRLTSGFRQ
jgi:hypothetical protein